MPRRSWASSICAGSWSSIQIRPPVGSIIRLIIRSDVVLPHPDGPTRTVILPVGASNVSSSTAKVPSGYCFETASNRIMPANLTEMTDRFSTPWQTPRRPRKLRGSMSRWIVLRWRKQGPHHEVGSQVMPRSGRKQHGVAGTGKSHELDVDAVRRKVFGELEGLAGIGDAICLSLIHISEPTRL